MRGRGALYRFPQAFPQEGWAGVSARAGFLATLFFSGLVVREQRVGRYSLGVRWASAEPPHATF